MSRWLVIFLIGLSSPTQAMDCRGWFRSIKAVLGRPTPDADFLKELIDQGVPQTKASEFIERLNESVPVRLAKVPVAGGMINRMRVEIVRKYLKLKSAGFPADECADAAFVSVEKYIKLRRGTSDSHAEVMEALSQVADIDRYLALRQDGVSSSDAIAACRGIADTKAYQRLRLAGVAHDEAYEACRGISNIASYEALRQGGVAHSEAYEACRGIVNIKSYAMLRRASISHKEAYEACRGLVDTAGYLKMRETGIGHEEAYDVARHYLNDSVPRYLQYRAEGLDHGQAKNKLNGG